MAGLQKAVLTRTRLQEANLNMAQLQQASLRGAELQGADLRRAQLQQASLPRAQLQGANLSMAHLNGAHLKDAQLNGANLSEAQLAGTDLSGAQLENADLRAASIDRTTRLTNAILTCALLDQVILDNPNLTVVDWDRVLVLGDELEADQKLRVPNALELKKDDPIVEQVRLALMQNWAAKRTMRYAAAARAYRRLMIALQVQGLGDVAARYAYRAQVMQRKRRFYERRWGAWVGSLFLALLAGYGYRLWRILAAYAIVVTLFAVLYSIPGLARHGLSADLVSTHSLDAFARNV